MEIAVEQIPEKHSILIPVAEENLKVDHPTDVGIITCGDKCFKVSDFYVYGKDENPQTGLMKLALGQYVGHDAIFRKYSESKVIYLFICDEIDPKDKPEKKEEEKVVVSESTVTGSTEQVFEEERPVSEPEKKPENEKQPEPEEVKPAEIVVPPDLFS